MTDFRMVLPDDRDGGWLRLIDGTESVVATEFIDGPVAELVGHLAPGDTVTVMNDVLDGDLGNGQIGQNQHKAHRCEDSWLRVFRMRLAVCDDNTVAYGQVIREIGDCSWCLRNAMATALHLHCEDYARNAGSLSRAADLTMKQIVKETMPNG
jgi:hypothetical protein